ncbi:PEPxxWA-CTERM sorting domain-containing protein [Sphingomonas agri]|uniref:PEPxxWA-CTERM sorting domain-containing protein n=1 Tax=Sphingomonas agri TaxID=1813878 RepID=UPI00311EE48E
MRRLFLGNLAAFLWTSQVAAATIVYTLAGTGSGHLGALNFTNAAYSITATGDTANLTSSSFYYALDPLSSVSINIAGIGDLSVTVPLRFGEVPNSGFFFGDPAVDILDGFFTVGFFVDISLPFGPLTSLTATTDNQFVGLPTQDGLLSMTSTSNITYSAIGGASVSTLPALLPPGSPIPNPPIPEWYCNVLGGCAVGNVPEPSTWAMMILGLGAIGFAVRRRRWAQPLCSPPSGSSED